MATLDEILGMEQATMDYSEDPESVLQAERNLRGLEKESGNPINPMDLSQIIQTPGVAKPIVRNAIASGYQSPELAARLSRIDSNANAAERELRERTSIINAILADKQQNEMEKAKNDAEIIQARQLQASMTAAEYAAYLNRANLNISDVNQEVNKAAGQQLTDYQTMMALKKSIAAKASTSFFDDPVNWIMDQLSVGDDVKAHNAIVGQYNQREEFIKSAASTASLVRDANAGKIAATTNAEASALARNAELAAQKKQLDLHEEAQKLGIATTQAVQNIQAQATNQLGAAEARVLTQEDRAAQRERQTKDDAERMFIAKERVKLAQDAAAERSARAELAAEVARQTKERDDRVSGALQSYGITTQKQLDKEPAKRKAFLTEIVDNFSSEKGYSSFNSPGEAISMMAGLNKAIPVVNAEQAGFLKVMTKMTEDVKKANPEKKGEQLLTQIDTNLKERVDAWQKNPTTSGPQTGTGDNWRLFKIQPMDQLAKNSPSLGGNKVALEVGLLKAAIPATTEITPQMVLTSMVNKIPPTEWSKAAEDVAAFFQAGLRANNDLIQPERFGFQPQTTYHVPFSSGGMFGATTPYDLASVKGATIALAKLYGQKVGAEYVDPRWITAP